MEEEEGKKGGEKEEKEGEKAERRSRGGSKGEGKGREGKEAFTKARVRGTELSTLLALHSLEHIIADLTAFPSQMTNPSQQP